jgi:WD40 repeat protein
LKKIETCKNPIYGFLLFEHDKLISSWSIWSLEANETNSSLNTWKTHDLWIYAFLLNGDNELISGSNDRRIKVWNFKSYDCEFAL